MLQVTLELESNPFIFAGQQEVSCAPSEASSDIGIAKAAQPASHAPTDPSSPVTAEPASRASRFETGQQEVSCAPSEASSDIAKVAQPASRAPTVTAAPTHPRDTLASDNSVTEYPTDRGKFPVDLEDDDVKRGSIKRWELLETHLSVPKAGQPTLKRLCPTRWASRQDAVQSLRFRYADIMQALTKIDLLSKKSEERAEATGLKKAMESFEFVVMTVIQGKVLETVNIVSQALQRKDVDLLQATAMLGNATDTLAQLRGEFDGLKAHAQDLASSWGVHSLFKDRRARRTKRHFSELCEDQRLQDPGEHFRVAVFYANIDIVVAQLKNRFVGMSEVAQRFSFLLPRELLRATDKDLSESASALSGQYKDDLSAEFPFQILSLRNALRPTIKKIERGTIKDLAQTLLIENQSILPNSTKVQKRPHLHIQTKYLRKLGDTSLLSSMYYRCMKMPCNFRGRVISYEAVFKSACMKKML
ncbi:hypothetical protein JOQ06_022539 [Pogonophryne albipinna]|uniref:Uncharacterized protein n=1 Tax=Pogonophryne albipinna TaxID=1090488 RepID=A0AAD6F6C1_9TELE|nr:hypothetical protein JOQ06_022539 [Pogonophryne albipinna]